jgi:integrase
MRKRLRLWRKRLQNEMRSRHARVVLYSLRHTFLTRLGQSGCDVWTLARIAGHASIAISSRYVHPSEDAVLDAISRLGGHKIGHSENALAQLPVAKNATSAVH